MGEVQPQDANMTDIATSRRTESIDNPLFVTDEVDTEPASSISFTSKRMHGDDQQIIPRPATAMGLGEVPSISGHQQAIINERTRVN